MTTYSVAGIGFEVKLPDGLTLNAFEPFEVSENFGGQILFSLEVEWGNNLARAANERPLAESYNDLGYASLFRAANGAYDVEIRMTPQSPLNRMTVDSSFIRAKLTLDRMEHWQETVVSSMLRILFSQAALSRDVFLIHASAVENRGWAYLFMGASGTGKSTHARQWLKNYAGSTLLNDDNPAVSLSADGKVTAWGTPWSGKTSCYRAEGFPLGGFVRLSQASENRYKPLVDVEAFMAVMPGVSVFRTDKLLYQKMTNLVSRVVTRVAVGQMQCRPDDEAAILCGRGVAKDGKIL